MAGSGFPPLSNIPHCCLPQESGPCLSPSVADHPLRPATDRRLGRPLPYQLANPPQAHLVARGLERSPAFPRGAYAVLARVSPSCPPLPGRFLRVTHPFATLLTPDGAFAFDLHVLSMPPAFNLSQDQTLQFKLCVPRTGPTPKGRNYWIERSVLTEAPSQSAWHQFVKELRTRSCPGSANYTLAASAVNRFFPRIAGNPGLLAPPRAATAAPPPRPSGPAAERGLYASRPSCQARFETFFPRPPGRRSRRRQINKLRHA